MDFSLEMAAWVAERFDRCNFGGGLCSEKATWFMNPENCVLEESAPELLRWLVARTKFCDTHHRQIVDALPSETRFAAPLLIRGEILGLF